MNSVRNSATPKLARRAGNRLPGANVCGTPIDLHFAQDVARRNGLVAKSPPLSGHCRVGYGVSDRFESLTHQGFPLQGKRRSLNLEFSFHGRSRHQAVAVLPRVFQQHVHHDSRAGFEPAGCATRGSVAGGLDQRDRDHPGGHLPGERAGGPAGRPRAAAAGGRAALCAGVVFDAVYVVDERLGGLCCCRAVWAFRGSSGRFWS